MINLKTFAKPVDSRIEKQRQLIHDQEKILESMRKELNRLERLKAWAEGSEEE